MPRRLVTPDFYRRNRWEFVFVVLAVTLLVAVTGTKVNSDRIERDAREGAAVHAAVCLLRRDYAERYAADRAFLRHPSIPLPAGVLKTYRLRVDAERRTLEALSALKCG